jgi:hypothetical protein
MAKSCLVLEGKANAKKATRAASEWTEEATES